MGEAKTKPTTATVAGFLDGVADPARRADAHAIAALLADASGTEPAMWGPSIVGFGAYRYRYDSGREGEMCRIGFSPRAKEFVFYGLPAADARLGKHKAGKGCLYVKRLADIDAAVLADMARAGFKSRKPDEI